MNQDPRAYRPFKAERTLSRPAPELASASATALADLSERIGSLQRDVGAILRVICPDRQCEAGADNADKAATTLSIDRSDYEQQARDSALMRNELRALSHAIEETKREIAELAATEGEDDRLDTLSGELDAIVSATESATETILSLAEKIDRIAEQMRVQARDEHVRQLAEEVSECVTQVFEASNFQDLTGQRISKVVSTLKFVDERVERMVAIWGRESLAGLRNADAAAIDDSRLLSGPQQAGAGISQDDIDKLFD